MPVRATARMMVLGLLLAVGSSGAATADSLSVNRPNPAPTPVTSDFPDATLIRVDQTESTTLRLDGIITPAVEQRFSEALRGVPAGQPVVVELSSPGGFTTAGYRMIDLMLAERQAGRSVATRVAGGQSCESMCVGLYLAGYPRYAAPTAEFMVHAPRLAENGRMTLRSTDQMVKRLVALGAAPAWIERVRAAGGFSGSLDYRDNADHLAAVGANIVTHLIR
ncbi:ATP-dependent Clp protease proteolytic subunit [Azospirillum tabaci]|uniref:ATP-dependent Clp protease proteolytic subunit n=1 Tax=Azospirillum tabaci TaxID=2752310 RepID=UPI0016614EDE|nr:ATP-dependent Clp protease proteolytic subunit [Azospirillum tabaci]